MHACSCHPPGLGSFLVFREFSSAVVGLRAYRLSSLFAGIAYRRLSIPCPFSGERSAMRRFDPFTLAYFRLPLDSERQVNSARARKPFQESEPFEDHGEEPLSS